MLQLVWAYPTYISQSVSRDVLRLKVIDPLILTDSQDLLGFTNGTTVQHSIPFQVIPGAAIESLVGATGPTTTFIKGFIAGNMFVQIFFMFSLSMLWGLVNGLMIIAYWPLLNILIPSNVLIVDQIFYTIATFDLIPMDWFKDWA